MTTVLVVALLAVVIVALVIAINWRRTSLMVEREREVAARFEVGPDGIIPGAQPIDLAGDPKRAVLLVHGYGDTPQTMRYFAEHLNQKGWTVRAILLPGHGRRLRDLARARAGAWIVAVREEYAALRARHETVCLAGLSMGGALCAITAVETPPPALVLLAPYLSMPRHVRLAASTYRVWAPFVPYLSSRPTGSVLDPRELGKTLSPGYTTGRLLRELYKVVRRARGALPRVTSPTLVICSRTDNRVPAAAAARNFTLLGAPERQLVWREGAGHVITVDYGRDEVFSLAEEWLTRHSSAKTSTASV